MSVTELGKIEEQLVQVVENFTEKIEQEEDGATQKAIRSKQKIPKKIRKLFQDFKENARSKDDHMKKG